MNHATGNSFLGDHVDLARAGAVSIWHCLVDWRQYLVVHSHGIAGHSSVWFSD